MDLSLQSNIKHIAAKPLETSQWNPFEIVNSRSVKARTACKHANSNKGDRTEKDGTINKPGKPFRLGHYFKEYLSLMLNYNSLLIVTLLLQGEWRKGSLMVNRT